MIINDKACEKAKHEGLAHNIAIRKGTKSTPPVLPLVQYEDDTASRFIKTPPAFERLCAEINQLPAFTVSSCADSVRGKLDLIAVKHETCGNTSFYGIKTTDDNFKKGKVFSCQNRSCYEQAFKIKLGKDSITPSQKGVAPANKKTLTQEDIHVASKGTLQLHEIPPDHKTPFKVKLMVGENKGQYLQVSSHSNWRSKGTYEKVSNILLAGKLLSKRHTVLDS